MLQISRNIQIADEEIEIHAIRAGGPGGQNVNKVSSAIHLRFDISASSLPEYCKQRLLKLADRRITREGVLVIKAQQHRTQEKNRADALARLQALIEEANTRVKPRIPTRPARSARKRRVDDKVHRGRLKHSRKKISD